MSAHTPGPWDADMGEAEEIPIYAPISGQTRYIAGVAEHHVGRATCEANARLMAAAPELLKVLENFSAFTYRELAVDPSIWAEFLTDARAALAKARQP